MNLLERALVTKAGYDNGWEAIIEENAERVVLTSSLHRAQAEVTRPLDDWWFVRVQPPRLHRELQRAEDQAQITHELFGAENEAELGRLLRQAARLAKSLPDAPEIRFAQALEKEANAATFGRTETERIVKQRIGQDIFRESMMEYWEGACSVTGIAVAEILRASHAKAWADCATDSERLNVYNGFLLAAHLDALFDRYLMTFDDSGDAIFAPCITTEIQRALGLTGMEKLRWITPEHLSFLASHRQMFQARLFTVSESRRTPPSQHSNPRMATHREGNK